MVRFGWPLSGVGVGVGSGIGVLVGVGVGAGGVECRRGPSADPLGCGTVKVCSNAREPLFAATAFQKSTFENVRICGLLKPRFAACSVYVALTSRVGGTRRRTSSGPVASETTSDVFGSFSLES